MALQVWLPLNGDLRNQGLTNITATNSGATIDNSGKIGKCYSFTTSQYIELNNLPFSSLTHCSISLWIKVTGKGNSGWLPFTGQSTSHYLLATSAGTGAFYNSTNNVGTNGKFYIDGVKGTTPAAMNEWHHYVVTDVNLSTWTKFYINKYSASWNFAGSINDVRIYDHCLSPREINEISKALLVHYKLDGDTSVENLFTGTAMTPDVRAGFVNNGSTDWTKPFRYYNGSTAIHTFSDTVPGEDTIKLSTTGNLGIAFVRSAADINLDSSAYYTISCKAKCSASGKKLCIGLSYYTTSNSWVWRGGNNAKAFSAVNTWQTFTLKFKPDANTQYICYCFTVAGTANGTATFTIKECKLEKGSSATAWTPSKLDSVAPLFYKNPGYDCSGYCRNGEIIDNAGVVTGGRFNNSIKNSASTLLKSQVNISALETITFSWWQKVETWGYQSSGLFATSNNSSYPSDYSTTACAHRDVGFDLCTEAGTHVRLGYSWLSSNGSTLVGSWHHMAITYNNAIATLFVDGTSVATTDLSGALKHFDYLYIGNSLNRYTIGAYSDFRIYGTALTAEQVLELYNTAAFVDNKQNVETFEFDEVTSGNPNITKSGIFKAQTFTEDVAAEIYEAEVKANQLIEI